MQEGSVTRVDLDNLINRWAQWLAKRNGVRLDWVNSDGQKEADFNDSTLPHLQKTRNDFERVFGKKLFIALVGEGPKTLKTAENFTRDCRRNDTIVDSEGSKVGYAGERLLTSELRTDVTIGVSAQFSVGIGNPQILGFGIALSGHADRTRGHTEGKADKETVTIEPKSILADHICIIEQHFDRFRYVQLVEITGHVVVSFSGKINPGPDYTDQHESWTKWAIPVVNVLRDLGAMQRDGTLVGEPHLEKFEIDQDREAVFFKLNVTEEKVTAYRVSTVLKEAVMQEFDGSVEKLKLKHRVYSKDIRVDTLFTQKISAKKCTKLTLEDTTEQGKHSLIGTKIFRAIFHSGVKNAKYHVLVCGEPGVGKTTLTRMLMSRWGRLKPETRKDYKFEWVLHISLGNLNEQRYPKRQDGEPPYSVGEIITKECFPEDIFPEIRWLKEIKVMRKDVLVSLWYEQLREMLDLGKILLILDGYEEKPKHGTLASIFSTMQESPFVVFTSRAFDEADALDRGKIVRRITVKGFSQKSAEAYVSAYFSKNQEGLAKMKLHFAKKDSMELCRIPFMLESICFLVAGDSGSIDPNAVNRIEDVMHEHLVMSMMRRFLTKFLSTVEAIEIIKNKDYESKNPMHLTSDRLSALCKFELGFLEHFAFSLLRHEKRECSLSESRLYIADVLGRGVKAEIDGEQKKQKQAECQMLAEQETTRVQSNFGFLIVVEVDNPARGSGPYRFIHPIFENFFAARYLAHCLQMIYNPSRHTKVSTFPHEWVNGVRDVEEYIKTMGPTRDLILELVHAVLKSSGDDITQKRLDQLEKNISVFDAHTVSLFKRKIKKSLPSSGARYDFELLRENTRLCIQCKSSTDKKKGYTLGALYGALESLCEDNRLIGQGVLLKMDTDNDQVTIDCHDISLMDAITQCLREVSAPAIDSTPLTHAFFSRAKTPRVSGEASGQAERSSVSCVFQ